MFRLKLDGVWNGEKGRRIAGALPVIALDKGRGLEHATSSPAPTDDERLYPTLFFRAHIEERGALGRAQPLVEIAGVDIDAERGHVERDLARRMRAVDDDEDAGLARALAELFDRKGQGGGRGDVAEENGLG